MVLERRFNVIVIAGSGNGAGRSEARWPDPVGEQHQPGGPHPPGGGQHPQELRGFSGNADFILNFTDRFVYVDYA